MTSLSPFRPPSHAGQVIVIVPTYMRNNDDWLVTRRCLDGLQRTVPAEHTIMVVDDCSPYKTGINAMQLKLSASVQHWTTYLKPKNEGFASAVNVGLRTALQNEMHALLVNADMEFHEAGWFREMLATPGAVVGAKLLYPQGIIQHAGIYFSAISRTFDHIHRFGPPDLKAANFIRKCPVTAALQLIKASTLRTVGLYDEQFQMGWDDVDYCLRVFKFGLECVYNPRVCAIHHESTFRAVDRRDDKLNDWTRNSFRKLHTKHAGLSFGQYVPMLIGQDPMRGAA